MAEKLNTLTCKQCGYANEGERVYCHNCGTKLDRALLPTDKKTEESPEKKQKRIRKIVSPSRGFYAGFGQMFVLVILWSALLALVIQAGRAPDKVPAALSKDQLLDVRPIGIDLEDAMQSPVARRITLTQAEINNFLQYTVKSKPAGLVGDEVQFIRAFASLDEGVIQINTEQTFFGHPVYASASYKVAIKNQKVTGTVIAGSFGRVMVDPHLMMCLDVVMKRLWEALSREKKLVDQFQSIEVHKDRVDLISRPMAR